MSGNRLLLLCVVALACARAGAVSTPAISSGAAHTLALDANGQVYAWGGDNDGQLGQGRQLLKLSPLQVAGLPAMQDIAIYRHALAVDTNGQVWSWGDACGGQLGPRETALASRAARVLGATGMKKVAAGGCYSLALKADGTVWTWGALQTPGASGTAMRQIAGLTGIVEISAAFFHGLALKSDGTVYAFGGNASGQIGNGAVGGTSGAYQVPGITNAIAIAAGSEGSVALLADGQLRAWGRIAPGQAPLTAPTAVTGLGGTAKAISYTSYGLAATRADGTVWKWDRSVSAPTQVSGLTASATVEYSEPNALVFSINTAGALWGTGDNFNGELGQGNTNVYATPVTVPGFTSTIKVRVAPSSGSVLALRTNGTVWFWGRDANGTSGDGAAIGSSVPLAVTIGSSIRAISAGSTSTHSFSVALDIRGNVWGWGDNENGVLGNPKVSRSSPALIPGASYVVDIAAGGLFGFVLYAKMDGTAWIGGYLPPILLSPGSIVQVAGLSNITRVAASYQSAFFLRSDGVLFAAGGNSSGELGDGTNVSRATPQAITIPGVVTRVSAGRLRVGAVTSDGRVYMWGSERLGNGTTTGSNVPVQVPGITDAVDISVGRTSTLVKRANGSVVAWGLWGFTNLDDASGSNLSPFPVAFHETVQALASGDRLGFFVGATGAVWGWGESSTVFGSGTVGDGTYVRRTRPVVVLHGGGTGSVDANNWYLDLQPATLESIPAASIPKALAVARLFGDTQGLSLESSVKYKSADFGKPVNVYILARVPPEFFDYVPKAAGTPSVGEIKAIAKARAGSDKEDVSVLAQLTPTGWSFVQTQLTAFTQTLAGPTGTSTSILSSFDSTKIPGGKFCIGYGESAESLLTFEALREVLAVSGASSTLAGVPCVLTGLYVNGPVSSTAGSPVTFKASVVGVDPTGSVQFLDGAAPLGSAIALQPANPAVSVATLTLSSLAQGTHAIGASYPGDAKNPPYSAEIPVGLEVVAAAPGESRITLSGPAGSDVGSTVVVMALVTGNNPGGTVQFKLDSLNHGDPAPVVGGLATLRTSAIPTGVHSITAAYSGDALNSASTSSALLLKVYASVATEVILTTTPNPSTSSEPVTITATVSGQNPSGYVVFRDGGKSIAQAGLVNGTASQVLMFTAGTHELSADYPGDGANAAATSPPVFQFVGVPDATVTTLAASPAGSAAVGSIVTFTATVVGGAGTPTGSVTFKDGDVTLATVSLNGSGQAMLSTSSLAQGSHAITASYGGSSTYLASSSAVLPYTIGNVARVFNISTRGRVLTGDDVMIAGFIIGGSTSKRVVVNVAGPSLFANGIANPLANPTLTLVRSADGAVIGTNDNWQAQTNAGDVAAIQASGFQPNNALEPAIIATLAPGAYTAIVSGVGGGTGVALVGLFEVDHPEAPFINISTRMKVLTGDEVMIAGFIVQGTGTKTVVVNAAGPSLVSNGIANPLANPTLTLVRSADGAVLGTNDNWQAQANAADVAAIQATGFQPNHALEPAIIATLAPGAYTAIVSGVGGGTGVALVGVFVAP